MRDRKSFLPFGRLFILELTISLNEISSSQQHNIEFVDKRPKIKLDKSTQTLESFFNEEFK